MSLVKNIPPRPILICLVLSSGLFACTGSKADTSDFFDPDPGASDDRQDPLVALTAPTSGQTVSGEVSWSAVASDDVGVASVTLSVDGSDVGSDVAEPWEGTWDASGLTNGPYTLTATARDGASNEGTGTVDVLVSNEDGLSPDAITITSPSEDGTLCGVVTVETSVSDEVVKVVFSLDGVDQEIDTSTPFAWDWDTTLASDGTHTLSALASDADGRSAADAVVVTVSNDDSDCDNPPAIVFTKPVEGAYLAGAEDVSVTASDDVAVSGVVFYVDSGTLFSDTSIPYSTSLDTTGFEDGGHTLTAVATDSAGQTSETEISVIIDNEAPEVSITSPDGSTTLYGDVSFAVTATDNLGLDTVELSVDGDALESFGSGPYETTLDTTTLSRGSHELEAVATDLAGNESSSSLTISVDNPPQLVFTAPADTTVYGTVTVSATATDDDRVTGVALWQDGTRVASTTSSSSVSTTIDTCDYAYGETIEMEATATDSSAQVGSQTETLTVDQLLQVELDTYSGALDPTTTLGANVGDDQSISSVVFALDGTTIATTTRSTESVSDCLDCGCKRYTTSWSTASASEGTHTLSVTATNAAGDTATDSTTVTIDYDQDGDGYNSEFYGGDDCDDDDASYHPGATEACDGEDEDCDGEADDAFDVDGDGYLDADLCAGLTLGTDCDDGDATIYPSATEICDGQDNDCDGYVDNESDWTTPTTTFGSSSDYILANGAYGNVYEATRNGSITGFYAYIKPNATSGTTYLTWVIYESSSLTGSYELVASNDSSTGSHSAAWYSAGSFDVELTGGHYYLLAVYSHSSGGAMYRYGDKTPDLASGGGLTVVGYLGGSSSGSDITDDPSSAQIFYQEVVTSVPAADDADADSDGTTVGCGDCDDLDDTISPDATEVCDGADNDCDGSTDEGTCMY